MLLALLLLGSLDFTDVSGVKVSCLENIRGKTGRARIELVVGAGALHELEEARGVAHLLEHLLMRPLGFDDANAVTSLDYTTYFRDVRAAELSTAAIDLTRALSQLPLDDFDVEKNVVLAEIGKRSSAQRTVDPLFGNTLLNRDVGGGWASVRDLTKQDVESFFQKHYVRGNIALFARGAVSCEELQKTLAPELAKIPAGQADSVPRVTTPEPGPRALSYGADSPWMGGFYWYDATIEEEMAMRVVAKHLEQLALDELRKTQGLTYSPVAEVRRLAGGGQMQLRVATEGRESLVADWYEEKVGALRKSTTPAQDMKRAAAVVADVVENDVVRFGLAAIRGEQAPDVALAGLDDTRMQAVLAKMLAADRSFSTTTPSRNIGSILVLVFFGVVVAGAVLIAARSFIGR